MKCHYMVRCALALIPPVRSLTLWRYVLMVGWSLSICAEPGQSYELTIPFGGISGPALITD